MTSRLIEIDALRTLSCLIIIIAHTAQEFVKLPMMHNDIAIVDRFFWQIDFGRSAVALFFAISGYVIIGSLKGPIIAGSFQFWVRRLFRLYPAFWVSIPVGLLVIYLFNNHTVSTEMIEANLSMLPKFFGQDNIIGVYWTLETELIFYFLCWLLFLMNFHTKPLVISIVITLLVLLTIFLVFNRHYAPDYHYWLAMPYHLSLMFWAALYRIYENEKKRTGYTNRKQKIAKTYFLIQTAVVLLPITLAFSLYLVNDDPLALRNSASYFFGLTFFILFVRWIPLKFSLLANLGKYTFSIYLFHLPVILLLVYCVGHYFPVLAGYSIILYLLIIIVVTMLLSLICYHCIEKPCIAFSQRIS